MAVYRNRPTCTDEAGQKARKEKVPKFKDISGQRFGLLVAQKPIKVRTSKRTRIKWECKCDCGNIAVVTGSNLASGHTKSCGCLNSKMTSERNKVIMVVHGGINDRLYEVWGSMKKRCNNPNDKSYKNYGGRGIKVCKEWNENYLSFKKWAYKNGYDENAPHGECTIDRINVNGNYEPNNCRWISNAEQQKNKRKSAEDGRQKGKRT